MAHRKMPTRISFVHAVAIVLVGSAPLAAHPLSVSYSRVVVRDRDLAATVRLPLDDMDLLLRLDRDLDGVVSPEELVRARTDVERYVTSRMTVAANDARLVPALQDVSVWKDSNGAPYLEAVLEYTADRRINSIRLQVRILTDLYPDHRNLADIQLGGQATQFVFQHDNAYVGHASGANLWRSARSFVALGIEHIVTGYDHIVFLFGLLLVGRGFGSVVAIVTSFTVAHSLTLALATFGVVEPAARTIEAAIALSIAYIGFENLVVKDVRHRWKIAFLFGLVHGLGFATVLREMHLPRGGLVVSLLTFNLGVEIGQVVIVAAMVPVLRLLHRTAHGQLVTRLASVAILAVGLFWFHRRVV